MTELEKAARQALEWIKARAETEDDWNMVLAMSQALEQQARSDALDKMAENARELGLDYEPPCKTGSQCTSKCQQCEQQPAEEPVVCLFCGGDRFTTRPQPAAQWVGLTFEDSEAIIGKAATVIDAVLMTEAKLREKNGNQ